MKIYHKISFLLFFFLLLTSSGFTQQQVQTKDSIKNEQQSSQINDEQNFLPHRDIPDIPIPYLMKLDKNNTFILETKGVKVGILSYRGRVDGYSLAETLKNSLTEEKWTLQNILNYKNTSSLSFVKDQRSLIIFIEEGFFTTRLELRLSLINQ